MAETRPIIVQPLQGVDQRWPANAPTAAVARDLWWTPFGALQSSGGYARITQGPDAEGGGYTSPFAAVGPVESLHEFVQHNGARSWLIYLVEDSGNDRNVLYVYNPPTAARSASPGDLAKDRSNNTIYRARVRTPWIRHQSAAWGDQFYMVNGIDRALVFDGYSWDYAGWTQAPGPPRVNAMDEPRASDEGGGAGPPPFPAVVINNTGLGPLDTATTGTVNYKCAFRYRIAYRNERGALSPWSAPSDVVYFVNVGDPSTSNKHAPHFAQVSWTRGPASAVSVVIARTQNLYDSSNTLIAGREEQYFVHSEIQDNATWTIMDGKPDGFLLPTPIDVDAVGPWPTGMRLIKEFNGRMYGVGTDQSVIRYSARGQPEVWPTLNALPVGSDVLGPVTGWYATRNALVVFKARKVYLVRDDGVNEPTIVPLDGTVGCVAANTIREVPGVGLCFLSEKGIGLLQGTLQNEGVATQILNSAVELPLDFRDINWSAIQNACSEVYAEDKEWWLVVPQNGAAVNRKVLVYHYETRQWTTREKFPISCLLAMSSGELYFGSYATTTDISPDGVVHRGIYYYSRGCADKDGTAIEPLYITNHIEVADQFRAFRPYHVLVKCIGHGKNPLLINIATDDNLTNWMEAAAEVMQMYPQQPEPVYGTGTDPGVNAVYDGTDKWQQWHPVTVTVDIEKPTAAPVLMAAIRLEPASGKRYMTLFGLSLEVLPSDPVKVLPLKPNRG